MPRKPGVYRNIKKYKVKALCVDLKVGITYTEEFETPIIKDKNLLLKHLQSEYNNSKRVIVKIKSMIEVEKNYFLSIDKFFKYAIESEVK